MSVDFPAPFSPTSACTSPRSSSKRHWSSARTPGNDLSIPIIETSTSLMAAPRPLHQASSYVMTTLPERPASATRYASAASSSLKRCVTVTSG